MTLPITRRARNVGIELGTLWNVFGFVPVDGIIGVAAVVVVVVVVVMVN